METQNIIFVGVRNKKYLICNAIEQNQIHEKEHICFKNWSQSSTAMESDIIVEGMNLLERLYKIRCTRLVGNSHTVKKIQEKTSYENIVLKVKCANHAIQRCAVL